MIDNLPGWLGTVFIIGGAAAVLFAAFTSKYQRRLTADRERYIAHLEAKTERQAEEIKALYREHDQLKGRVEVLTDLLMGRCDFFSIDETTGGCRHCSRFLLYGKQPEPKNTT